MTWRVIGASARGAAHVRDGRPNQDSVGWTPDGGGTRIVAAVSDGHGGAPHVRSDRGARLAVACAQQVLAWHADEVGATPDALPRDVLTAWRRGVADDLALDPLAAVPVSGAALAPYGATLIALTATRDTLTLLQIGDGDLLLVGADGTVQRPLVDDAGLVGEETYSLCLDDAERRFRTLTIPVRPGLAAVLASDGVSKSFRDDIVFADAVRQLAAHARADFAGLAADLPGWLDQLSLHGSGDDASLALALHVSQGDDR